MFEVVDSGNIKWDGKAPNGKAVPDGTYFYVIKAEGLDGKKYDLNGSINIFK
jgi:flagellar hook assembly protein FlgD